MSAQTETRSRVQPGSRLTAATCGRRLTAVGLAALLFALAPAAVQAQIFRGCAAEADAEIQRLPLGDDAVTAIRYERKLNPTDQGPEVLGVRAWVRLKSCTGWLVIDMTRSCFVRQSYTRGDCSVEGVTRY
ncbi:hypothetical protein [Pelagibius sp.]|uniref:hypothetical protein n=1 Tax=Pelagibius sp. TaxID=1931238 RepID=UPI0026259B9E|nr:hypothetical protein [Pelagibius sp.]